MNDLPSTKHALPATPAKDGLPTTRMAKLPRRQPRQSLDRASRAARAGGPSPRSTGSSARSRVARQRCGAAASGTRCSSAHAEGGAICPWGFTADGPPAPYELIFIFRFFANDSRTSPFAVGGGQCSNFTGMWEFLANQTQGLH